MSSETVVAPVRVSPQERSVRVSRTLSDAARRLRFSTSARAYLPGSHRVRRQKRIGRIVTVGSFLLLFLAPSLAAISYFGFIASDQYVSEAKFAVRSGSLAGLDALTSLTGVPAVQVIQDTQVVTNYVHSRALVELLMQRADLKERYSLESVDGLSRLDPSEPIEKVVRFWKDMSSVSIQMPGGIVTLSIRAFRPDDAVALTNAVVDASEELVNDMNDRARKDALGTADQELNAAAMRLAQARAALEIARNREGILDVSGEATKTNTLIGTLRTRLLEMQQQYETLGRSVSPDTPQMRNLRLQIEATGRQITQLQAELTNKGPATAGASALSGSATRLASFELERQIAEAQYTSAAASLERARLASGSKDIYLTSFVRPVPAEEARFPRRVWNTIAVMVVGLLCWGAFCGLSAVARKRLI